MIPLRLPLVCQHKHISNVPPATLRHSTCQHLLQLRPQQLHGVVATRQWMWTPLSAAHDVARPSATNAAEVAETLEELQSASSLLMLWQVLVHQPAASFSADSLSVAISRLSDWYTELDGEDDVPAPLVGDLLESVQLVEGHLPQHLPGAAAATAASIVYGLATLRRATPCSAAAFAAVTSWCEGAAAGASTFVTIDLLSLLWGYTTLLVSTTLPPPVSGAAPKAAAARSVQSLSAFSVGSTGRAASGSVEHRGQATGMLVPLKERFSVVVVDSFSSALAVRIRELKDPLTPEDLSDIAWALSMLQHRSAAVARLLEAVAYEVRRQLSNRHSAAQATFLPQHLVKVVSAFAQLQHKDGEVLRMLDTVGGQVAKRIRANDPVAFTRPSHIAALLTAFARLRHVSVAVPELLAASARQLCRELADANERLADALAAERRAAAPETIEGMRNALAAGRTASAQAIEEAARAWRDVLSVQLAVDVLDSYISLGFFPDKPLLHSLMLAVTPQLQHSQACSAIDAAAAAEERAAAKDTGTEVASSEPNTSNAAAIALLHLLGELRHHPGEAAMQLLVSAAEVEVERTAPHVLAANVCACAALQHPPGDVLLSAACTACLPEDNEAGASGASVMSGTQVCGLLQALQRSGSLTIQRLGRACVQLRGAGGKLGHGQFVQLGRAVEALGEEGSEMAATVLPQRLLREALEAVQAEGALEQVSDSQE